MKNSIGAVLAVFCLLGLSACSLVNRGCTQANRIVDKTIDADNVIYNYEYFKRQYQEVLAQERKVANLQRDYQAFVNMLPLDRSALDWNDKSRINILMSNVTGAQNVYYNMVAEYNARAQMLNRSVFMGKDVPQEIVPIQY